MKMSWGVLMKDRELLLFPVFTVLGLIVVLGVFFGIASMTGSLERLDSETATTTGTVSYTHLRAHET